MLLFWFISLIKPNTVLWNETDQSYLVVEKPLTLGKLNWCSCLLPHDHSMIILSEPISRPLKSPHVFTTFNLTTDTHRHETAKNNTNFIFAPKQNWDRKIEEELKSLRRDEKIEWVEIGSCTNLYVGTTSNQFELIEITHNQIHLSNRPISVKKR